MDAFKATGFDVTLARDLTTDGMRGVLSAFQTAAEEADMVEVYFGGYGVQVNNDNYLIPVDAPLGAFDDLGRQAIPLSAFTTAVAGQEPADDPARRVSE